MWLLTHHLLHFDFEFHEFLTNVSAYSEFCSEYYKENTSPRVFCAQNASCLCVCLCLLGDQMSYRKPHKRTCVCLCRAPCTYDLPDWSQELHTRDNCPSLPRVSSSCASSLAICCCRGIHTHHT